MIVSRLLNAVMAGLDPAIHSLPMWW